MTQCNTNQLLAPELETYLIKRRNEVSTQLDLIVKAMSRPGNDTAANHDHRQALLGRITELDTLRQVMEADEVQKRQLDLDDFERSLNEDGYPDGEGQAPRGLQNENGEL